MTHGEKAKAYFLEGYNCSQAVALAFSEELEMEKDAIARLVSGFGGGMGRLREVCGCVSGMVFVAGALRGYSDPEAREEKAELYGLIQELAGEFRAAEGSIICRELLSGITEDTSPNPEERTGEYYKKRPCPDLAARAAEILARKLGFE